MMALLLILAGFLLLPRTATGPGVNGAERRIDTLQARLDDVVARLAAQEQRGDADATLSLVAQAHNDVKQQALYLSEFKERLRGQEDHLRDLADRIGELGEMIGAQSSVIAAQSGKLVEYGRTIAEQATRIEQTRDAVQVFGSDRLRAIIDERTAVRAPTPADAKP